MIDFDAAKEHVALSEQVARLKRRVRRLRRAMKDVEAFLLRMGPPGRMVESVRRALALDRKEARKP